MDPSKTVQRRDGRTLDGVRRMIPSRLPSVLLVTQMLNGTGTGPYYGPVQPVLYGDSVQPY